MVVMVVMMPMRAVMVVRQVMSAPMHRLGHPMLPMGDAGGATRRHGRAGRGPDKDDAQPHEGGDQDCTHFHSPCVSRFARDRALDRSSRSRGCSVPPSTGVDADRGGRRDMEQR
jgi:hypothetical protein